MARLPDIVDGLKKQTDADGKEIRKVSSELRALRAEYLRYKDLASHMDSRIDRIKVTAALLAEQEEWDIVEALSFLNDLDITLEAPTDIRNETPLWQMVREVVRQAEELRIVELENILNELGVKASRQALESAINAHKRTFKVRYGGKREKFVALK